MFWQQSRWWTSVPLLSNLSRLIMISQVCLLPAHVHVNGLPTFIDQPPDLIDLSKATKLGNVAVVCASNPQWVTMALRTIGPNHQSFKQLSVRAPGIFNNLGLASIKHQMGEADYLGWLELDHFLAQLHELRSIRPKVIFRGDGQKARSCAGLLLPEVTTGGIVDLENSQWQ